MALATATMVKVVAELVALTLVAMAASKSAVGDPQSPSAAGDPQSPSSLCTLCRDCVYEGTAELKVLGLSNHETIRLRFNTTDYLYCEGEGDGTPHTISFPWCGPLLYKSSETGDGSCTLVLDEISFRGSECAKRHHLPSKLKNLRMVYWQHDYPKMIRMTAEVYTVWPLGWKTAHWLLHKQRSDPHQSIVLAEKRK